MDGENSIFMPTVSGLAYHIDLSTESLRRYEINDKFSATIKKAKQKIEISLERRLAGKVNQ